MHYFRNSIITHISGILLAANLLNISIDPVDPNTLLREDLSVNDIESIVEFVAEEVLGHENSCEESDDQDSDKTSAQTSSVAFSFIVQDSKIEKPYLPIKLQKESFGLSSIEMVLEPFTSITTPPPKFS